MTASCIDVDLDWHEPADYPRAAAICAGCSERAGCEAGARARGEQWGMFGGVVFDLDGDAADFMLTGIPDVANVQLEHGTRTRRNAGCTCRRCTEAHRLYVSRWRAGEGVVTRKQGSDAGEQLAFEIGA